PAAIVALAGIAEVIAPALQISEIRTVRSDRLWLSPAYDRDSVTIHFTWLHDAELVAAALAAVEAQLVPLGARPHWGKLTTMAPSAIAGCYDRAGDFGTLLRSFDPVGKFGNDFVDAMFRTVGDASTS